MNDKDISVYDGISNVYYPIVAVDGQLFEARIDKGVVSVRERDHIQLYSSAPRHDFIIDVVRKGHFPQLLDSIKKGHTEIVESTGGIELSDGAWRKVKAWGDSQETATGG